MAGAPKHRQRFLSVRPGGWSRTPVNSSGTRLTLALDGGPRDHSARQSRRTRSHPPPQSASEGIGGARGLGNLVRPESHPEPRGFSVQWADPVVKRRPLGHRLPFGPALVPVWPRADRAVRTVPPAVCSQVRRAVICACHVHLCMSMFVWALLFRPGWRHLAPGGGGIICGLIMRAPR